MKIAGWIKHFKTPGRALEIGCGEGWILAALKSRGWNVVGLERTPGSARFAAEQLGVPMIVGGLESIQSTAQFDIIVLHQVLEHLPQPLQILQSCARLLRPGGRMIIEVPNLGSWQARYAGRHWVHLDVPRHLGHFTRDSIKLALERAGLTVDGYKFVSLEYDPFGWVQAVLDQLGFRQHLLLRWLAGTDRNLIFTPAGVLMIVLTLLLAAPSLLLSILSWFARQGAIMEVRARRS
jgi:SAM-dependent methyltransferase